MKRQTLTDRARAISIDLLPFTHHFYRKEKPHSCGFSFCPEGGSKRSYLNQTDFPLDKAFLWGD